jgi:hypothetical protein
MENSWVGEPPIADLCELLPGETSAALTTSSQCTKPRRLKCSLKPAQALVIARYRVVLTPTSVDRR